MEGYSSSYFNFFPCLAPDSPAARYVSFSALSGMRRPGKSGNPFDRRPLALSPRCRGFAQVPLCFGAARHTLSELLDRKWMLPDAGVAINQISFLERTTGNPGDELYKSSFSNDLSPRPLSDAKSKSSSFYIIRDDLLHPVLNGNKARKLDAVVPILREHSTTDVVTCGGCQSAHTAAVAVACAERGIRSHLLLRGEQPEIPTGYNLMSMMFGDVTYIPRSQYAGREQMLRTHAQTIAGIDGSVLELDHLLGKPFCSCDSDSSIWEAKEAMHAAIINDRERTEKDLRRVVIINEGAGSVAAMLGVIRLVKCLSEHRLIGTEEETTIVVDAGTGTTAVGLAIGALCLGYPSLPWKIVAVMLAETVDSYKRKESTLISDFRKICCSKLLESRLDAVRDGIVCWTDRVRPRRFGRVEKGEIEVCRRIAQETGILLDPIYTLASWEHAICLRWAAEEYDGSNVIMLHTGGTLNMFGLAQRYTSHFRNS